MPALPDPSGPCLAPLAMPSPSLLQIMMITLGTQGCSNRDDSHSKDRSNKLLAAGSLWQPQALSHPVLAVAPVLWDAGAHHPAAHSEGCLDAGPQATRDLLGIVVGAEHLLHLTAPHRALCRSINGC